MRVPSVSPDVRRWIAACLMLCATAAPALATEQIPDTIRIDGETRPLYSEPLGAWLDEGEHWAVFRERGLEARGPCSANWRGYRADWQLQDGRLRLQRIVRGACARKPPEIPLATLFPGRDMPIEADWYHGTLLVPLGEPGRNNHMGYSTRDPRYAVITIVAGREVDRHEVTRTELDAQRQRERAERRASP